MTIGQHVTEFAGLPVVAYEPGAPAPDDPGAVAWRITTTYEGGQARFDAAWESLTGAGWADRITALVIGEWGEPYDTPAPIGKLVEAASRLTGLTAIFLGEMTFEECEISWIIQGDVTPLLDAYPRLEVLTVRGGSGLGLSPVRHERLRELTFEAGGLGADVVRAVGESDLPALIHLEMWLGTERYGGEAEVEDLAGVLAGTRLPALRSLGLRDAEIADQVAEALAGAPVVARLERLDLSLGALGDPGATALLTGQPLTHLRELDLHHHFISTPVMDRLDAEMRAAGVTLDLSDAGDPDDADRFIEVSE
jgi:hypothetical protein